MLGIVAVGMVNKEMVLCYNSGKPKMMFIITGCYFVITMFFITRLDSTLDLF